MSEARPDRGDSGYGWIMVAVAFGMQALAFGGIGSVGVFLKPLAADFGWSRGEVSAGYTAVALSAAAFGIFWGWLADRRGGRHIALFGVIMMGLSYFALTFTENLLYYYLMHFAFGALGNSAVGTPLFATVGFWFTRNQGLAIGLMAAGGAFGQALFPFLARTLIDIWDWQTAYAAIGITFLALGVPLALLVRDPPSRVRTKGMPPPVTHGEPPPPVPPRVSLPFLSAAAYFCCICMSVPIVHVVALTSDRGIDPTLASTVLSVLMIAGISGRILGGKLADMVGAVPGWMIASAGQTTLVLLFPFTENIWATYVLAAVFGVFYSADMSSILVAGRMLMPARIAAQALGVVVFFGWLGMGTGAWLGGALYDLTGSYVWSYAAAALGGVVNLIILSAFWLRLRGKRVELPRLDDDPGGLASPGMMQP
ncbi:MAG: MFS transporter [Minwuia sp.]|uniref:MFS transporter n=1 Tax=Minwuia sp. TaxID=2493630 RepID=UPI003A888394